MHDQNQHLGCYKESAMSQPQNGTLNFPTSDPGSLGCY